MFHQKQNLIKLKIYKRYNNKKTLLLKIKYVSHETQLKNIFACNER
jgi:hypothetical protein